MERCMKERAPAKPVFQPKEEIYQCYWPEPYPDSNVVRAIYQKLEECFPEEYRERFERQESNLIYEIPFLPANWVSDAEVPDELRHQKLIWEFSPDGVVGLRLVPCSLVPQEAGRSARAVPLCFKQTAECDDWAT